MDSPPPPPETPPAPFARNRPRTLRRSLAVSASLVLVLILVVLVLTLASPNPQFVWMTPAQIAQATHPGPLTQLKYKLMRPAGPLMRFYHSHRPNILLSSNIITISSPTTPAALGAPFITNSSGMNVWILSPAELLSFRQALNTNSGVTMLSSPRILTASGGMARAVIGQSIPLSLGVATNIGISLDTVATASSGSVKLLLGASSTELAGRSFTNGPVIKTNFSAACRVLLPDAGALVINCRNADPSNPTNYWLVVSPVLVDATGQPIKH